MHSLQKNSFVSKLARHNPCQQKHALVNEILTANIANLPATGGHLKATTVATF